jgi:hypothetical protein
MVMGAAIVGDGSQGSRKEKKCQAQESRMQMYARKRGGAVASVEGKSGKVAVSFGAYLLCKSCSPSRAPRRPRSSRTVACTRPPPLTPNDWWARARKSKECPLEAGGRQNLNRPSCGTGSNKTRI